MIALHYSKYDVLAVFRNEKPTNIEPSVATLEEFDADLFSANEEALVDIMTEEEIPTTKGNKSTVLLFSRAGGGNLDQRVRRACRFFKHTRDL